MNNANPKVLLLISMIVSTLSNQSAFADSDLQANPYRPSVGSPATLSTPNHFEVEFGVANANTSGMNDKTSPLLIKYAFSNSIGISLGLNPFTQVNTDNGRSSGYGDGSFTLKFAQPVSDTFVIGEELSTTLPIADHNLGSHRANQTLNLIASNDFQGFHSDVNVNLTHIGDQQDNGVSQQLFGWSAGISHPLTQKVGGGLELSGNEQQGTNSTTQTLEYLNYNYSNKTVFDVFTAQQKLGNDTHNYSFGFGVTHLFAQ